METIPLLFKDSVARWGNRPALIEPVEDNTLSTLSYQALQKRVLAFAGYLQQQQLAPGARIMIWSPSRSNWLIAYLKGRKKNLIVLANGMNVYPEDIENILQSFPTIKEAVIIGLMENNSGPNIHAILLMEDASKAKSLIQQANKQLASHQQIKGFTIWPEQDFPRTHTLKVKRQEVLAMLPEIRKQKKEG